MQSTCLPAILFFFFCFIPVDLVVFRSQLVEQYGSGVPSDLLSRSRSDMKLDMYGMPSTGGISSLNPLLMHHSGGSGMSTPPGYVTPPLEKLREHESEGEFDNESITREGGSTMGSKR